MNTDLGLFVLRIITGLGLLVRHGWPKVKNFTGTMKWLQSEGFPLIFISTCLVVLAEFVGSICLVLGVYTQYASMLIAGNMLVVLLFHIKKKHPLKEMEDGILYLGAALCLAIAGGGAWILL